MFKKQQGMALVAAIMFVAIAAGIAVYATSRNHRVLMRMDQTIRISRAESAMSYSLAWASTELAKIKPPEGLKTDAVHLEQTWKDPLQVTLPGGVLVQAQLSDLQGRWNINNIPIITGLEHNSPDDQPPGEPSQDQIIAEQTPKILNNLLVLSQALRDSGSAMILQRNLFYWVQTPRTELEQWYLDPRTERPRYRPAHQPFASVSEVALVQNFNAKIAKALSDDLSALPMLPGFPVVPINVNTCSEAVLSAVTQVPLGQIRALTDKRPFIRKEDFQTLLAVLNKDTQAATYLTLFYGVNSNYFLLTTTVKQGDWATKHYALLRRGDRNNVALMWQAWGAF